MRCRSALTRVDALRTGELPDEERQVVHEHLNICPTCGDSLGDVASLAQMVKAIAPAPPRSCRETVAQQCVDLVDTLHVDDRPVLIAFTKQGLRMIRLGVSEEEFRAEYASRFGRQLTEGTLPDKLRRQVEQAISGEGVAKPAVDLDDVTEFERSVLEILTRIPKGEVRSYAWVAAQAGRPNAVRAVGNICARNVVPFVVPCHRVVPTTGGIGNYAFGEPEKRKLLRREGVAVDELDDLAQKRIRYIGSKTTKIFCVPTCRDCRRIREENRVPFRDAEAAMEKGFRPCRKCQPIAA